MSDDLQDQIHDIEIEPYFGDEVAEHGPGRCVAWQPAPPVLPADLIAAIEDCLAYMEDVIPCLPVALYQDELRSRVAAVRRLLRAI